MLRGGTVAKKHGKTQARGDSGNGGERVRKTRGELR